MSDFNPFNERTKKATWVDLDKTGVSKLSFGM